MKKYSYLVAVRLFILVTLPITVSTVLMMRIIYADISLWGFTFALVLSGILYSVIVHSNFGNVFAPEITNQNPHELYKEKLDEYEEFKQNITEGIQVLDHSLAANSRKISVYQEEKTALEQEYRQLTAEESRIRNRIKVMMDLSSKFLMLVEEDGTPVYQNHAYLLRMSSEELRRELHKYLRSNLRQQAIEKNRKELVYLSDGTVIEVKTTPVANRVYLIEYIPINDKFKLKSSVFRKNREIEYVSRINSVLVAHSDINELLDGIISSVKGLFKVQDVAVYSRQRDDFNLIVRGQTDADLSISLKEASDVEIDGPKMYQRNDNRYVIQAMIHSSPESRLYVVMSIDKPVSTNDMAIIRMFAIQTSIAIQRAQLFEDLRRRFLNTISSLIGIIEAKDKYTEGHSRRVALYTVMLAEEMGFSAEDVDKMEVSAILHDIGKIAVDSKILQKDGKLSDEEYEAIKHHAMNGLQIIGRINFDERIKEGVAYHHVRYDLKGYPREHNLTKQPKFAAVIAVADAFDAMTSKRSYNTERTPEEALRELVVNAGSHFDPEVVEAMKCLMAKTDLLERAKDYKPEYRRNYAINYYRR